MNYIEGLLSIKCGISRYLGCVIFGIFSQHHYSEIVFLYQPRSIALTLAHQSVPYKGEKLDLDQKHIFFRTCGALWGTPPVSKNMLLGVFRVYYFSCN